MPKRREILALIPARGGSKGILGKNIRLIGGQPLISHSIQHALGSSLIGRTLVSTDDERIAAVARDAGAEVPFMRPDAFAQDLSPDVDVFRHALEWLDQTEGYVPELMVHLRPTGPVRRIPLIDEAIQLMLEHPEADSLRSVNLPELTPYKMWRIKDGLLRPLLDLPGVREPFSMPRQLLPPVYWHNTYVDIVRPRTVLRKNSMTGDVVLPFIIKGRVFDLDYEETIPEIETALAHLAAGDEDWFKMSTRDSMA